MFMSFVEAEGVMALAKRDLSKFIKFGEFHSLLFLGSLKLKDPLTLGSSDAQKHSLFFTIKCDHYRYFKPSYLSSCLRNVKILFIVFSNWLQNQTEFFSLMTY